ncbi:hypothetical protein D3C77_477160 [compost metagenome]
MLAGIHSHKISKKHDSFHTITSNNKKEAVSAREHPQLEAAYSLIDMLISGRMHLFYSSFYSLFTLSVFFTFSAFLGLFVFDFMNIIQHPCEQVLAIVSEMLAVNR